MTLGHKALMARDLEAASKHFDLADSLGRGVAGHRMEAHKGLLQVGWERGSVVEIGKQSLLVVTDYLLRR